MQIRRLILGVLVAALMPSLILSQGQKYANCHTPESAGNFVASDETIVNGMVCKVVSAPPAQQQMAANRPVPPSPSSLKDNSAEPSAVITNARVIELSRLGLDDDIVLAKIRNGKCQFQLGDSDLVELKKAGVSPKVIAAMLDAGSSGTAPAPVTSSNNDTPKAAAAPEPASSSATEEPEQGRATGTGRIPAGARVVIAPMGGFETYFAAAVREKKVPITLTLDKASAQYFVVSTQTEWQGFVYGSGGGANWTRAGGSAGYGSSASSTRGLEASIMLIDAKTKDVVWAYEVHKNSHGALLLGTHATRGQQSLAEACAKHLREYIEKGK
ncbi:MAG TPA: hypothetical protein VEI54_05840 [Candidatus Limnocylindrales bacterium]|nr:hypothetical protein [Candidatus Limnocylindrales bacterium]